LPVNPAHAARIKDFASLEGVRSNALVGYGLVVGLNGTGDSKSTQITIQSLVNMMERLGVSVDPNLVKVSNVAAVMVTAELPAFAKAGNNIDVLVSSLGDATSLAGGTLLRTSLTGPDGATYAVAQGPLVTGSLAFGGKAAKVQQNHPTVGRLPGGATVEREVPVHTAVGQELRYRLKQADFTTVSRTVEAINSHFGQSLARAVDGGSLSVAVPRQGSGSAIDFIAVVENLDVIPDVRARIVINERTGTIVMGQEVRIDTVAVSHSNLNLVISESAAVSQPNPFGEGDTVVVPQTDILVTEDKGNLVVLNMGVRIGDVAQALNAIGATPRDLIAIFQAIQAAGALHAELVVL
jgi:flagellar P-ring protein precursor FlgI